PPAITPVAEHDNAPALPSCILAGHAKSVPAAAVAGREAAQLTTGSTLVQSGAVAKGLYTCPTQASARLPGPCRPPWARAAPARGIACALQKYDIRPDNWLRGGLLQQPCFFGCFGVDLAEGFDGLLADEVVGIFGEF